jgi:GDP/UDP-N,N'-diacetylbacillosamine 2-epimerase (hydrolysing)
VTRVARKISVVTGSRADYGLLRWLMAGIRQHPALELQLLVTGMHLAPEFGLTSREIIADGFTIDEAVEMLLPGDTALSVATSTGRGVIGCAEAFSRLQPDVVVVLGDRFEILAAATAALIFRIPIAHLHGGEATEAAFDESIRHAITKMSSLHFVAAEEYRRRVIQLGEDPARVFLVGGLGVDAIARTELMDRAALEESLGMRFGRKNLLVTFHPATLEAAAPAGQMAELLAALDLLADTELIFTLPNADTGGRALIDQLRAFGATRPRAHIFESLGQRRYLSCLAVVDGVVGNSSSGLTEVPAFRKGTINIGDRQKGRLRASSVIDCAPNRASIANAISVLYSSEFQDRLSRVANPYGDGGASDRIVRVLAEQPLDAIVRKRFHDVPAVTEN